MKVKDYSLDKNMVMLPHIQELNIIALNNNVNDLYKIICTEENLISEFKLTKYPNPIPLILL